MMVSYALNAFPASGWGLFGNHERSELKKEVEALLCRAPCRQGDRCTTGRGPAPMPQNSSPENKNSIQNIQVLVSFSMPEEVLKSLWKGVTARGGRLVMRGLLADSFQKTKQRLQELGMEVDVDPEIFSKFHVQAVPFFIWKVKGALHTLQGNVHLDYALSRGRP